MPIAFCIRKILFLPLAYCAVEPRFLATNPVERKGDKIMPKYIAKNSSSRITAVAFILFFTISLCFAGIPKPRASAESFNAEVSAQEIVDAMTVGINIGNQLDCCDNEHTGLETETLWGNPKITSDLVDALVEKGFKTIRLPVTWYPHVDENNIIDSAWLARVAEVVKYTYGKGVFVILNSHHDNDFYDIAGINNGTTTLEVSCAKMTALWTQIAKYFKDYGERLLFEVMNEPRDTSSDKQWLGGVQSDYPIINALNKAAVDAIRATGGNNQKRFLMTPTYCAAISDKPMKGYVKPNNDDRIIVALHTYSNQIFSNYNLIVQTMIKGQIDKAYDYFVSKGTPVVIDEMGWFKNSEIAEEQRVKWAKDFASYAKKKGITCLRWDDNGDFVMYNRHEMRWAHEREAEALIEGATNPNGVSVQTTFDWWIALCIFAFILLPLGTVALVVFLVLRRKKKNTFDEKRKIKQ